MTLPLSKCYDPADFADLAEELATVDREFGTATAQAAMRRWEYAMAIRAIDQHGAPSGNSHLVDVGGAGSPFWRMVPAYHAQVVDPAENQSLADYLRRNGRLCDLVTCLSVIEHVPDLEEFLYHLSCLVAPGGLLIITTDCTDQPSGPTGFPKDDRHFHWMRERIFNPDSLEGILDTFVAHDFAPMGGVDWTYHGMYENWGYAAASLVMTKRA